MDSAFIRFKAIGHLEHLLIVAHAVGMKKRQQWEHGIDVTASVNFDCKALDNLNVSFNVQNQALQFLNEAGENKEVWNCFYRRSKTYIAGLIFDGMHFNDIVKECS